MFGIGPFEMLVVAVLALLLFSPRELPKIIKGISQLWGTLRRTADEFRDAIMQEDAMQELKDAVDGTKAELRDAESAARRELMKARMEARRAENKLLKVARERERQEREAAQKTLEEGGEASEGEGLGPTGTVASGSSSVAAGNRPNPTVDPRQASTPAAPSRPVPESTPAPKTVDPRHASAAEPDGSGDDSSASQGAA
ncbi:MAG: hypothetical protein KDK70_20725 [Myxococcales bacterium]|nr:hypothetical protein [Myxococcales bacterium]